MRIRILCSVMFLCGALSLPSVALAQSQELTASDGAAFDGFGFSVANDRNVMVVGAPYADVGGNADQGAAYVFVRRGNQWEEAAKLSASDGGAGDNFGWDAATDGRKIVVTAMRAAVDGLPQAGALYVFERQGQEWLQSAKLVSPAPESYEFFGASVGMGDDRIITGALYTTTSFGPRNGSAYVFREDRPAGEWLFEAQFDSGENKSYGMYGTDVDIGGDAAIVGMRNWGRAEGAVYFYDRRDDAWHLRWSMMPNIFPCCTYAGKDVAVDKDVVVYSVSGDALTTGVYRSGLVEVMDRTKDGFDFLEFLAPSPEKQVRNGAFGREMAYGSGVIAATNPRLNEILLFTRGSDGEWSEAATVDASPGQLHSEGGFSVGYGVLAAGQPYWDVGDNHDQGNVLVYDLKDVLGE